MTVLFNLEIYVFFASLLLPFHGVYAFDLIAAGLMEIDLTVRSNFQI